MNRSFIVKSNVIDYLHEESSSVLLGTWGGGITSPVFLNLQESWSISWPSYKRVGHSVFRNFLFSNSSWLNGQNSSPNGKCLGTSLEGSIKMPFECQLLMKWADIYRFTAGM